MGAAFKPVAEVDRSPEMLAILARLKSIKEDPNAKPLNPDDFNWARSRERLKHVKEDLSDAVIEERREGESE